ncbi:MAG: protein kinase [Planctomycetes bacterium]|nr:protein kinase [Planctomycetota bacterium]
MNDPLEALLAEFWAAREAGVPVDAEAFAAANPAHSDALLAALRTMLEAERLLPAAGAPTAIAGYRVERRLGRGATGEVFAVVDADGRRLALKRLLPHAAAAVRAQHRLQREARILRELEHPSIVSIVDFGEDGGAGGLPFLVMERIDGQPLGEWIADARRIGRDRVADRLAGPGSTWQRIARLGAAIAEAVAAAHEAGVLHRDLKPGNILLRADGTPVVVDFGLAAADAAATLTDTGDVLGTPHYMAPEQARGEPATAASDVFAIGAILYELLTSTAPRHGRDTGLVLDAARRMSPPTPRSLVREIPRELDLIVRRAMAFRPAHRHASAGELACALRFVADGGRPIGLTLGAGLLFDEFWRRRRRTVLGASAAVVLLVGVLAVRGTWSEAHAARVRTALIAATEANFDGAADEARRLLDAVAPTPDPDLVALLRGELPPAPEAFAAAMLAGRAAVDREPRAALADLERAVARRPDSALAVGWLGIAAARSGALDVAERELLSAVRTLPASVRLRVELSKVLRHDRVKKAAAAVPHMRIAVTLPRADSETWHELARALSKDRQYEEALTAVEHALQTVRGEPRTAILRTKALLLDALGRRDEAIPLLRAILDDAPTCDSWTSYGAMLDKMHRLREAADAYRQALSLDPNHAPSLLNLIYLRTGSDSEGCARCRACFQTDPGLADPDAAEQDALRLLNAEEGRYTSLELAASYLGRTNHAAALLAAIDERLQRDLPAEPLGRLVRARRILQRR